MPQNFYALYFSEDLKFWTFLIFRSTPTKSWTKPLTCTRTRSSSSYLLSCLLPNLKSLSAASASSSKRRADVLNKTAGATHPLNKPALLALGVLSVVLSWLVACFSWCSAAARSSLSSWSSSVLPLARSPVDSAVNARWTAPAPAAGLALLLPHQHPLLLLNPSLTTTPHPHPTAPPRRWTLASPLATPSLNKCWLAWKTWALLTETRTFVP